MPDAPFAKSHPHPYRLRPNGDEPTPPRRHTGDYAELAVRSNFSFLTGASHPEELVARAAELGHRFASIADRNSLAGIVRAHVASKDTGIPLAVGCRLELSEPRGMTIIVYPTTRPAYAGLCRLLTLGKRRAPKGECHLTLDDLLNHQAGALAIVMPTPDLGLSPDAGEPLLPSVASLRDAFDDDRLSIGLCARHDGLDRERLAGLTRLARRLGVPTVATNEVLYHEPARRPLQDVLTCIRHGCTIQEAGARLGVHAERFLKPAAEMHRLFDAFPESLARTLRLGERASAFSLDELKYEYPVEACPEGTTPIAYLRRAVEEGARERYPDGIPPRVTQSIEHELAMIEELRYEAYFLTCYDIVRFARSRGILCQGRGGAANSAVCYCLGITEVDPARFSLLFERFISRARGEPPDIDIDFEHERREEVLQYLYDKYGRDRAALTAEVISYRGRSAVREVGKAMGLSLDGINALARNLDRWGEGVSDRRVREIGLDPHEPTIRRVIDLSRQLIGFPRHLSQHVGGFVITRGPLHDLVPIENAAMEDRTVIEWDKDDIDAMGMLKVDCLGLGMLTCIRRAFELLGEHRGEDLSIPAVMRRQRADDPVYEMIQQADTVGVFQIESRAQMSMLPRLKPREFYDLVIEVAIVRPGPIQGKMVHPYLRRRRGEEAVEFPNDRVRAVLGRTLGVPLFQEQAMQLSIVAAGFTPDEADQLRRAMAAWKRKGDAIRRFGEKIIAGMLANGYPRDFAERCFEQIKGFSEYGFPESHAASFAILVYVSAWLKKFHPAAFAAALINRQPRGFFLPAQIVRDAKEHGVEVRPVDVNHSDWDCTLEEQGSVLRLGMRLVKGMPEQDACRIRDAVRTRGDFATIESLWRASGVSVRALRCLARGDAFGSMGLDRQRALWQIKPLRDEPLPLFAERDGTDETGLDALPAVPIARRVLHDYHTAGLSLKAHPISFIRDRLDERDAIPNGLLRSERACPNGREVRVAGLVLCRQRPSTASGVVFITLEDETGIANLVLWRDIFERYRRVARLSVSLLVRGKVERDGSVVHIHAQHVESLDELLPSLVSASRDFH
ncbi:MAG: error-prone DNA polymerase [Phycisphaerales bacterium JB037]